jgi:hypothetical protein
MLEAGEVTPFNVAKIVAFPAATPVTAPVVLSTLAVAGVADVQLTERVISAVVPSE